jgi:hypothetical protein
LRSGDIAAFRELDTLMKSASDFDLPHQTV